MYLLFDIFDKESCVGKAQIQKEGMYYRICCTCNIAKPGIHRIVITDGETDVDLGICVPQGEKFTLTSRIPIKFIKGDNKTFHLVRQGEHRVIPDEPEKKREVPVASDKPFSCLDELEKAYFKNEDGNPVVVIDSIQDQPDSDQSRECP